VQFPLVYGLNILLLL